MRLSHLVREVKHPRVSTCLCLLSIGIVAFWILGLMGELHLIFKDSMGTRLFAVTSVAHRLGFEYLVNRSDVTDLYSTGWKWNRGKMYESSREANLHGPWFRCGDNHSAPNSRYIQLYFPMVIALAIFIAFPLYELYRAFTRLRSGPPRCGNCGYNLTALTGKSCPECGGAVVDVPTQDDR